MIPSHSHYLQSKVVRARERIEAEMKVAAEEDGAAARESAPPQAEGEGGSGSGGKSL